MLKRELEVPRNHGRWSVVLPLVFLSGMFISLTIDRVVWPSTPDATVAPSSVVHRATLSGGSVEHLPYITATLDYDANDWLPTNFRTAAVINVVGTGAGRTITGFADGVRGRRIDVHNQGEAPLTLAVQSYRSMAANRIKTYDGKDIKLMYGDVATLYYDGTNWVSASGATVVGNLDITGMGTASSPLSVNVPSSPLSAPLGNFVLDGTLTVDHPYNQINRCVTQWGVTKCWDNPNDVKRPEAGARDRPN